MTPPDLTAVALVTTTRSVRRPLILERQVPTELIRECVEIALQAPTGGNSQGVHFLVVADRVRRAGLAEIYGRSWASYRKAPGSVYDRHEK